MFRKSHTLKFKERGTKNMQMKIWNVFTDSTGKVIHRQEICGEKHELKLSNGEVIDVITDKRCKSWFVTDIESGLLLIPSRYYGFIVYDTQHDCSTEENALETAKFCIENYLKDNNITFAEMRGNRLKEIQQK